MGFFEIGSQEPFAWADFEPESSDLHVAGIYLQVFIATGLNLRCTVDQK
jgi:hypothetical protein